jgi:TatD DNase family protein
MELIDIGINLMNKAYNSDRDQVIKDARKAKVNQMIITGTSLKSSIDAADYAHMYSGTLYSTAGIHPHDVKNCDGNTINELRKLAKKNEVVAIGECGLDFNRLFSPKDVQEKWFEEQIKLAVELNMPLFLHERDAHKRFVEILSKYEVKAIVHCFTSSTTELHDYLNRGYYIGITGWVCDERRGIQLQQAVKHIPLDKLMIETDGPYLTPPLNPRPQGNRNEPQFLPYVLNKIAKCMGKPTEEVANAALKNTKEFFNIQ